ncbi:carbohydrate porin [Aliagarivorans marinus]|uniref:carbohydrate porin n=1 Tax=Aliagarivorans marinus TaxID=561965 RepID=UPI000410A53F|nr:carbohydrate porin [Aliagarivorans marinus]
MKLKALSIACSAAFAACAISPSAMALDGFEFHGYFRTGTLFSVENDLNQAAFPGSKENMGRLGLESDDFYELAFNKGWELEDGKKITIKTRLGENNVFGDNEHNYAMQGYSIDAKPAGLLEAYVEFEGLTSTGVMWGGQRYYGRDNYNFLTDFFYTDWSGTGLGVQRIEAGGGHWDFAYLASNHSNNPSTPSWNGGEDFNIFGLEWNAPLHMAHVRAEYGAWRIDLVGKYMSDNELYDGDWDYVEGTNFATSGFETAITYTPKGFFGISDSGFSNVRFQAGQGLGGGTMLGRSFTNYNLFSPGGAGGFGGGQGAMSLVDSSTYSYRVNAMGGWFGSNMVVLPWLQYEYQDFGDDSAFLPGESTYFWSVGVRPVFTLPSIEGFAVATELSYFDAKGSDRDDFKLTIAPTWSLATGTGPAPEIRVMATYLDSADGGDGDVFLGVQADMWW